VAGAPVWSESRNLGPVSAVPCPRIGRAGTSPEQVGQLTARMIGKRTLGSGGWSNVLPLSPEQTRHCNAPFGGFRGKAIVAQRLFSDVRSAILKIQNPDSGRGGAVRALSRSTRPLANSSTRLSLLTRWSTSTSWLVLRRRSCQSCPMNSSTRWPTRRSLICRWVCSAA
jgi:hypothetical protein